MIKSLFIVNSTATSELNPLVGYVSFDVLKIKMAS